MPEYKESSVAGTKYTRANKVVIENPYGGIPLMTIIEEDIYIFPDLQPTKVEKPGNIYKSFDPFNSFPLRNPLTDELLGTTSTEQDLQVIVYSLVRHLQAQRDLQNEPPVT